MQLPRVMPEFRRQTMGHDDRANPAVVGGALEFGGFRLLVRQRQLLAGGVPVELGARAFDILMVLIEADGALVTKDELQSRVWPGVFVAQDNLKVQICALRKALGESGELIRTEHGRGYRFTATVRSTVTAPKCLAASRVRAPQPGWKAALSTDLSVIALELVRLEDRLAEALNVLQTHRNSSRLRPARYAPRSSNRRMRRRRPIGSASRVIDLPEKLLDLAC